VLVREARPLRRLAQALDDFGKRGTPIALAGAGTPGLKPLIERFDTMQDRIAALIGERTLMLGSIAHDLKTFITRIRLRLELMPETPHREAAVRDLDDATHLIDDALLYSRAAAGPKRSDPVDLAAPPAPRSPASSRLMRSR
jgi:two-component system, OmpR family, osmolarity sensor histidine kinase EnvZ